MAKPNKRIKHYLVIGVLFDEPVTEDEAVRIVRKPLDDIGTMLGRGDKFFSINRTKSLTRVMAAMKETPNA